MMHWRLDACLRCSRTKAAQRRSGAPIVRISTGCAPRFASPASRRRVCWPAARPELSPVRRRRMPIAPRCSWNPITPIIFSRCIASAVALRRARSCSTTLASRSYPAKTNALLWGDSLAAHYFHGISKTTEQKSLNILQATQMQCMPTLNAVQGNAPCRSLAAQMDAFLRDRKPDLVIMSADWLEYARPPRFDGMIADLRRTISQLNALGVPVILLGPVVQFRSRLPSMLMRAQLRAIDAPSGFRAAGYFRARPNDESSIAGAGEVFLRFGGRCDLSGAAMPAHDRRGHSAGVGSCAPHRGGVGVCDGQVDADARA